MPTRRYVWNYAVCKVLRRNNLFFFKFTHLLKYLFTIGSPRTWRPCLYAHFSEETAPHVYMGWWWRHSVYSSKRRHVGGIICGQCSVVILRMLVDCYLWNYARSTNDVGIRKFLFSSFYLSLFKLCIPPIWRHVMTMTR